MDVVPIQQPTTKPSSGGGASPTAGQRPAAAHLELVPLFADLSRAQLTAVAELAQEVRYSPGRMIVRADTPGQAFYAIVDGTAKVLRGRVASAMATWKLGPGDFFGEMALLDGGPRSASVVAETALTTIRIERGAFRKMLRSDPDIALKLLAGMATRMRELMRTPPL
jgi:CRP/FNR family cyclic AMP-dependent transcriptional regulator